MKEFTYTITHPNGLHGRPAADLVTAAQGLESAVTIWKGERCAGADRLMALMTLGITQGDAVTVTIEGGDEERSLEIMKAYFAENL